METSLIGSAVTAIVVLQAAAAMTAVGSLGRSWMRGREANAAARALEDQIKRSRGANEKLRQANHRLSCENGNVEKLHADLLEQRSRLQRKVADLEQELELQSRQFQEELERVRRQGLAMVEHAILLDGIAQAGKTCWIARVANPTILQPTLARRRANAFRAEDDGVGPVPFAIQHRPDEQRSVLHVLRLYDMVGEQPETFRENLQAWLERRAQPPPPGVEWGNAAVLAVWDLLTPRNGNLEHLNGRAVRERYGHRAARTYVKAVYFFMNKKDAVEADYVEEESAYVAREIAGNALGGLFSTSLVGAGSALTGDGVQDSLGGIARALDLTPHMPIVFAPDGSAEARRG